MANEQQKQANEAKQGERGRKILAARFQEPVQVGPHSLTSVPSEAALSLVPGWVEMKLKGKTYLVPPARFACIEVE
jgi:hypothetical protein